MSLPHVQATTFLHQMATGSTGPAVFTCAAGTTDRREFVVKFHRRLGRRIVSEYIATVLGHRLELPLPSAAIVHLDQKMAEYVTNTEVSQLIEADSGPHFGTVNIMGGYSVYNAETFLSPALSTTIASIFAFDMMTQNYDRVAPDYGSPNLLIRGDELVVIDHEKAFDFVYDDRRYNPPARPWMLRDLPWAPYHVFYSRLIQDAEKGNLNFDDILGRFETVTEDFLDEALDKMPEQWYVDETVNRIHSHLREIRANLYSFRDGLMGVFA